MLNRFRTTWQLRQRRRQIKQICRELSSAVYTYTDLLEMVDLSSEVEILLIAEQGPATNLGARRPGLADVLEAWPGSPSSAVTP